MSNKWIWVCRTRLTDGLIGGPNGTKICPKWDTWPTMGSSNIKCENGFILNQ